MRICMTGSTGFVGAAIAMRFKKAGEGVVQITRKQRQTSDESPSQILWDIEDSKLPDFEDDIDLLVHCAGLAHQPGDTSLDVFRRVNVDGTRNVGRFAIKKGVKRVLLISSIAVYGTSSNEVFDEQSDTNPLDNYGRSKLEAEEALRETLSGSGIEFSILRVATVIGHGDRANIAKLIRVLENRPKLFPKPGKNRKSFIHREDLADLVFEISQSKKMPNVLNAVGFVSTVEELVDTILKKTAAEKPLFVPLEAFRPFLRHLGRLPVIGYRFDDLRKWYSEIVVVSNYAEEYGSPVYALKTSVEDQLKKHR